MAGIGDTQIPPDVFFEWIIGGFAAFLIAAVVVRIIDQFHVKDQQRTVTGVAVTVGVATAVGFAPFGTIAAELAPLSRLIPAAYPAWVEGLAAVETVLGLLYTVGLMWESGGVLALGSLALAVIGGLFLPYIPALGFVLVFFAWLMMEASPADRW